MRGQAESLKYPLGFVGGAPAKIRAQAVVIPVLREFPGLGKRQRLAVRLAGALAPGIDIPFRPEEQDARSGSYEVVVPALERQRKVDDAICGAVMVVDVATANAERHESIRGIGIVGLDLGVRM